MARSLRHGHLLSTWLLVRRSLPSGPSGSEPTFPPVTVDGVITVV